MFVRLHSRAPNLRFFFSKRCLTNTSRRHSRADGELSSLYPSSPSFSSFGAACVMLCCSPTPASSGTPLRPSVYYPRIGLVVNIIYIRTFCVHLDDLYIFELVCIVLKSGWHSTARMPRIVVSPLVLPDEHPPTPPPSRWSALITLPTLAKFHLVWRRVCVVMLFPSCLFEHTLTAICVIPEYQSGRKYNMLSYIFRSSKCLLFFRPDLYRY